MTDERFVHVVSGEGAARVIAATLAALGRVEEVVALHDVLNEGPLRDVDASGASRADWWARVLGAAIDDLAPEIIVDDRDLWARLKAEKTNVMLWHGPHPMERLFELRACWHLREHGDRLHEVALRSRGGKARSARLPDFYDAVAVSGPKVCADAWSTHARINDIADRAKHWGTINTIPGDWLYRLEHDELIRVAVSHYDAHLLEAMNELGGGWVKSKLVVAMVLGVNPVTLSVLRWRVRELLREGTMTARGDDNDIELPEEVRLTAMDRPLARTSVVGA